MANSEHVNKLKEGVSSWNKWRQDNPDIVPDLGWANLVSLDLREVILSNSNLKLAFCRDCILVNADFQSANLYGTNFQNSNLAGANLENANLEGAHITNADLTGANLKACNLKLTNFDGSNLTNTNLLGVKKLNIKQLLQVKSLKDARLDGAFFEQIKIQASHLLD
ncbi:MAG: pentapeptide repeat-containing protein [Thermodesulfobacteriota bacterium]